MKIDYNYIKQALLLMEECPDYNIESLELLKKLKSLELSNDENENKFIGHIKILHDNYFIDCENSNLGIKETLNNFIIVNTKYRITAQGYEFLDILKNDTAFNKIKDFAISNAIDIGKEIIVKLATGGM